MQLAPVFAEQPIRIVTTVPPVTIPPVIHRIWFEPIIEKVHPPVTLFCFMLEVIRLLKANPDAEGEAVLFPAPG